MITSGLVREVQFCLFLKLSVFIFMILPQPMKLHQKSCHSELKGNMQWSDLVWWDRVLPGGGCGGVVLRKCNCWGMSVSIFWQGWFVWLFFKENWVFQFSEQLLLTAAWSYFDGMLSEEWNRQLSKLHEKLVSCIFVVCRLVCIAGFISNCLSGLNLPVREYSWNGCIINS